MIFKRSANLAMLGNQQPSGHLYRRRQPAASGATPAHVLVHTTSRRRIIFTGFRWLETFYGNLLSLLMNKFLKNLRELLAGLCHKVESAAEQRQQQNSGRMKGRKKKQTKKEAEREGRRKRKGGRKTGKTKDRKEERKDRRQGGRKRVRRKEDHKN